MSRGKFPTDCLKSCWELYLVPYEIKAKISLSKSSSITRAFTMIATVSAFIVFTSFPTNNLSTRVLEAGIWHYPIKQIHFTMGLYH